MKSKIRLSKPYINHKEAINYFNEILESGFFVQGKYVQKFEMSLKKYLNVNHCLAVSSGTAALHTALVALGIGPGDEIIVPAFTFPATVNVIELVGATPILVDVDVNTFNIDINQIESKITDKTKAIMVVHLFGNPANMKEIISIAKKYNIKVIEDSAGALGSVYNENKCGTIGDVGCFSFHPRKIITTGEGGAVVTNNSEIAKRIEIIRNHGTRLKENKRDFITPGFNYRMNELEAALGLSQINENTRIDEIVNERIKLIQKYIEKFSESKMKNVKLQKVENSCIHSYQAFVIRIEGWNNLELIKKLSEYGVEATVGAFAIQMLTYYSKKYGYKSDDYPNAKILHQESIALPLFNGMKEQEIDYVVQSLSLILK